jgi:mannose-6-phosphate isomerase-like protein (cupin superfamily)
MDTRFESIANHPSNAIFNIVFFPDRIYHAQYLNATRSTRYRYNVHEVRSKTDMQVMKGTVFQDGEELARFVRLEYRGSRLVEQVRERGRFLEQGCLALVTLLPDRLPAASARVRLSFCPWIDAFQVEIWDTLEPLPGSRHDYKVLAMMGRDGCITRIPAFTAALRDLRALSRLELLVREDHTSFPSGFSISDANAGWDDFYQRNIQVPHTQNPSDGANTIPRSNYLIDFQRNFFLADASQIAPVRYRNAMMRDGHPRQGPDNVVDMRWLLQEELGSSLVFFHEVTVPPGITEGTHQHIGSEELYYIVSGAGVAYVGEHDDPALAHLPVVDEPIFGLGDRRCREVPVQKGSVIYTKSGGIHGIRNPGAEPLVFVAFLYHSN